MAQCNAELHVFRCIKEEEHETLHESYGYRKDRQVIRWGSFEQKRETEKELLAYAH
jgi:hypothetical protein